jgi:hypothetical protein
MDEKKYKLNDEPVSARELIKKAQGLDDEFGRDGIYCTSGAAVILRNNGFRVEENEANIWLTNSE